jgi:hypothetical protein
MLGQQVSTGPFNKHNAWTFYRTIFIPSMGYVLPQSFYIAEQLKAIQTSAMSCIIAKCGYNKNPRLKSSMAPSRLQAQDLWHCM